MSSAAVSKYRSLSGFYEPRPVLRLSRPVNARSRRPIRPRLISDIATSRPVMVVKPKAPAAIAPAYPSVAPKVPESAPVKTHIADNLEPSAKKSRFKLRLNVLATAMAVAVLVAGIGIFALTLKTNHKVMQEVAHADSGGDSAPAMDVDEDEVDEGAIRSHAVAPDMPKRLMIDGIGVNARILKLGLTADSNIDAPKNIFDAGWFDGSAKPGTKGAALLVGHVSGPTKDGVFKRLGKLSAGDELKVEKGDGSVLTYRVVDKRNYRATDVDLAAALSPVNKEKQGLNLITCGGKFNTQTNTYEERVIVFTERVD